jgi:hypothetical protein
MKLCTTNSVFTASQVNATFNPNDLRQFTPFFARTAANSTGGIFMPPFQL